MTTPGAPLEAQQVEYERLLRAERTMVRARWVAVVFAFAQVVTFYRPYPRHVLSIALSIVGILLMGNAALSYALRHTPSAEQLRKTSIASLAFDLVIVEGLIWTYTFDSDTAIWAVLYLLPLGGAIRFQRQGALIVTAVASIGYAMREIFGNIKYNNEFLITSITFRCGIAFLIAFVAGSATKELLDGRRHVERANRELFDINHTMREFVSIASHDMRTPVSIISGLSSTMARNNDSMPKEQQQELLEVIHRRAQTLEHLVNDLLATSSIDAGILPFRPEVIDLADLISDVAQTSGIPGIQLNTEMDAKVYADPEHLRRILVNLLSNAERYGAPPVQINVAKNTPWVELSVVDSGNGVPHEFTPRLFEKFARAPETAGKTDGTGLGLSIVKGLVIQNGGTVTYKQSETGGAAFCVSLPEWDQAAMTS